MKMKQKCLQNLRACIQLIMSLYYSPLNLYFIAKIMVKKIL